jgi:hypothetical protein
MQAELPCRTSIPTERPDWIHGCTAVHLAPRVAEEVVVHEAQNSRQKLVILYSADATTTFKIWAGSTR